jgi:hypothetical protein
MSIARIPSLRDRDVATKVLSDLASISGPESIGEVENVVLSAYRMIKEKGENITELRLKEITNAIARGEVQVSQTGTGATSGQSNSVRYNHGSASQGNFFQQNSDANARGEGHVGMGQPYGLERNEHSNFNENAGVTESAIDALGAFTWNFTDSLLLGLPGFALNKFENDSGFSDFVEGMRSIDTEAGKYAQAGGIAASFLLPGRLIAGAGKAGVGLAKGNLVGKTFALGGKVGRKATGVTGAIDDLSKAAGNTGKKIIDISKQQKDVALNVNRLKKERDALRGTLKELQATRKAGKLDVSNEGLLGVSKELTHNRLITKEYIARGKRLKGIKGKETEILGALRKGSKEAGEQFYNTRRGQTLKEINQITSEGLKEGLKKKVASNVSDQIVNIVGDEKIAGEIIERALGGIDEALEAVVKGTKTWGEVLGAKSPFLKGFSERVGKVLQNGVEEAIGFSAHTLITDVVRNLGETSEYDLDTLTEIASEAGKNAIHSAGTAAVFAAGGGIPFLNASGTFFTAPLKLFMPSRKGDLTTFAKAAFGATNHSAKIFGDNIHKYVGNTKEIEKALKGFRQGIGGGSGNVLKRLRERGLIDYKKLGAKAPEDLARIAERLIKQESTGALKALEQAGGLTGRSGMQRQVDLLRAAMIRGEGKVVDKAGRKAIEGLAAELSHQAEVNMKMNWNGLKGAMRHDSIRNAMTGASVFMGADGQQMLEGLKSGDTHMSDVLTHALFSFTSASHGLHKLPGKAIGEAEFDKRLSPSEAFRADSQNKAMLQMMGIDVGPSYMFSQGPVEELKSLGVDYNDPQTKRLRNGPDSITVDDISRVQVRADLGQSFDPATEVRPSEARLAANFLREAGVQFPKDHPAAVLNELISKDKDQQIADSLLMREDGIGKALGAVALNMRKEMERSGLIDPELARNTPMDESLIQSYTNVHFTNKIRVLSDIAKRNFDAIGRVLGTSGTVSGKLQFGKLGKIEGFDDAQVNAAGMMLDRLMDVATTTSRGTVDYSDKSEPITGEKAEKIIKILYEADASMSEALNGHGLQTPMMTRQLRNMIQSGNATTLKATFVDGAEINVVRKTGNTTEVVGRAGIKELETAALQRSFIEHRGKDTIVNKIDVEQMAKDGVSDIKVREVSNFLRLLRARAGFQLSNKSRDLTANELQSFYEEYQLTIKNINGNEETTGWKLSELANSMSIDFSNQIAMGHAENHIMRAASSKISPEKFHMFNLMEKIGIIYDHPTLGRVYLKMRDQGQDKDQNQSIKDEDQLLNALTSLGADNSVRELKKDSNLRKGLEEFLNKELDPLMKDLVEVGMLSGEAPASTTGSFEGFLSPDKAVEQVLELVKARNFQTDIAARKTVGDLIRQINEWDVKKPFDGIDYGKLRSLESKLVQHLGGEKTSAYDWLQVKRIMDKFGEFSEGANKDRLKSALDEVDVYLRDADFVDSAVDKHYKGDHEGTLSQYDPLLGNPKHHAYTVAKMLGNEGLGFGPEDAKAMEHSLRQSSRKGAGAFFKNLERIRLAAPIKDAKPLSEIDKWGMFSSMSGHVTIRRISLGDYKETEQADVGDGATTIGATAMVRDVQISNGFLPNMGKELGLNVSILDGMVKLKNNNYSFFRDHGENIEAQKTALLSKITNGGLDFLSEVGFAESVRAGAPVDQNTGQPIKFQRKTRQGQSVILNFGDMQSFVVFDLPTSVQSGREFGQKLKDITSLYGDMGEGGAFGRALKKVNDMADSLLVKRAEGETGFKTLPAFKNATKTADVFRFLMNHQKLGVEGMRKIPDVMARDGIAKQSSRFRQINSKAFTETNTEAFNRYAYNIPGYKNNKMTGITLSDAEFADLLSGAVTRGDGQIFFHSRLLEAQAKANGFDQSPGVIKNHIIHEDMVKKIDAEGNESTFNQGTFMTKNAGTSTPEMDAFMEKHGLSFIAMDSAVKLEGSFKTGTLNNRRGDEVSYIDAMNERDTVTEVRGAYEVDIKSLRFSKIPQKGKATIGYQVENFLRDGIVSDLINAHYEGKISGANGVVNMARNLSSHIPEHRQSARMFVQGQLTRERITDRMSIGQEMSGQSTFNQYIESAVYGSPNDYWFKPKMLSMFKKGVMQDTLFKTKDDSGRQDTLVSDYRGRLDTNEAVGAHGMRDIQITDAFDGLSPHGMNLAFKLEGDRAADLAAVDVALHFGFKGQNLYNETAQGAGVGSGDALAPLQAKLNDSKYVYRRLYRMGENGTKGKKEGKNNSFITDVLLNGIKLKKNNGIFKFLNEGTSKETINKINDITIDMIEGKIDMSTLRTAESLPKDLVKFIADRVNENLNREASTEFTNLEFAPNTNALDGSVKMGTVYDVIGGVLGNYEYHHRIGEAGKQDTTWGIGGTNQRYPSARVDDTIPMVFLGQLNKKMGDQVMLNYYDSTLKGEADYDIDNYNYWFRSPESHFSHINQMRAAGGINKPKPTETKLSRGEAPMDPFSEADAKQYAQHQARSEFLRGTTTKDDNMVQKMVKDAYEIRFTSNGKDYIIKSKYKNIEEMLASKQGMEDSMAGSAMIQEIIDSKGGLLPSNRQDKNGKRLKDYMDEDFSAFNEILEKFFDVSFVDTQRPGLKGDRVEWNAEHFKMMAGAIGHYRKLLTFSKKSWVGDSSESMQWPQMSTIARDYLTLSQGDMANGLSGEVTNYLGKKTGISNIAVSLKHTVGMAENAAASIAKVDRTFNKGAGGELFGKHLEEMTELSSYLATAKWGDKGPSDKDVGDFAAQIRTKGWNARQSGEQLDNLRIQLKYAEQQASNGSEFFARKAQMLRAQKGDLEKIATAIRQGLIQDPAIMHKFATEQERAEIWDNTRSVEALKITLANQNLDPYLQEQMMKEAKQLRGKRGAAWVKELNADHKDSRDFYGKEHEKEIINMTLDYLNRWTEIGRNSGNKNFGVHAPVLAMMIPDAEFAYTGSGSKRYIGYKKMPADLFNAAMRLHLKARPEQTQQLLGEMAYNHAVVDQYMNGSAGEFTALKRMQDLRQNHGDLLAVAHRWNFRRNEMSSRFNVARNLIGLEESVTQDVVMQKMYDINVADINKMGNKTAEELAFESLNVARSRKLTDVTLDIDGVEVDFPTVVRTNIDADRHTMDRNGVLDKQALNMLNARIKEANKGKKPGEKDPFIEEGDRDTIHRVQTEVDRTHSKMSDLILKRDQKDYLNEINAGGIGGDPVETIISNRSGREKDMIKEGGC